MRKGKTAPIISPANISGLLREMDDQVLEESRLAFLRNPPKSVSPMRAEQPIPMVLLMVAVVYPAPPKIEVISLQSSFRLATLLEVEALRERGLSVCMASWTGNEATIPKRATPIPQNPRNWYPQKAVSATMVAGAKELRQPNAKPRVRAAADPFLHRLASDQTKVDVWEVVNYPNRDNATNAILPTRAQRQTYQQACTLLRLLNTPWSLNWLGRDRKQPKKIKNTIEAAESNLCLRIALMSSVWDQTHTTATPNTLTTKEPTSPNDRIVRGRQITARLVAQVQVSPCQPTIEVLPRINATHVIYEYDPNRSQPAPTMPCMLQPAWRAIVPAFLE